MKALIVQPLVLLAIAGCSAGQDRAVAERAVTEFHHRLDAGQFHEIYASASDDFRAAGTEAAALRLLGAIHNRLGLYEDATPRGWRINYGGGGSTVSLSYVSHFMRGNLGEDFTFRVAGGTASLVGYHVTSDAVMAALQGPAQRAADAPHPRVVVEEGDGEAAAAPPPAAATR
ncbi:hypothetical protein GCM10023232_11360 [Sphingosinicella ginsenosidimutans]|uniref:DUF4019 domain-containing protein n=1 Tax=Allosphingosinicella ginsenosidimutans TaxID=1176539 RepID=A0A5C6TRB2_9SPHN|nr:hypothetical protein [Sphingosinicella ginsenosidimutans]TXC62248.1 hypothetical protein FRZ32_00420 [Sphingosinicella ginsenosidimutans]